MTTESPNADSTSSLLPPPPAPPAASPGPSGRRSKVALAGLAAAVVAAGVAGPATARALADEASGAAPRALAVAASVDLDDVTLGDLAGELADMGLELTITPEADRPTEDPASDELAVDPFDGMTEDEIFDLSDDEFFSRIEEAGLDVEEYLEDQGLLVEDDNTGPDDGSAEDDALDEEALAAAPINGDAIDLSGVSAEHVDTVRSIWERFVQLIPADQRQMINSFELAAGEDSGAYVYPDEADPTKWILGVSASLGDDLDYVLIHEFGHLLTLQAEEVPPSTDDVSCSTYFTGEGCALKGSTMAEFVERFWPQEQIDEIDRIAEAEDYDEFDEFYENHKDDFVTDYATSNPAEDLAETFTAFVLGDERPSGDTIADQKVQMLWDDEDLVALRNQIRANQSGS